MFPHFGFQTMYTHAHTLEIPQYCNIDEINLTHKNQKNLLKNTNRQIQ